MTGQNLLREFLEALLPYPFVENCRPHWLNGLELDFYFDSLDLAFEFQGDQHYENVFGQENLEAQQRRDIQKADICEIMNVRLVHVRAYELSFKSLTKMISQHVGYRVMTRSTHEVAKNLTKRAVSYRIRMRIVHNSVTAFRNPPTGNYKTMRKKIVPPPTENELKLLAIKTAKGGYTRIGLASLGVPWPAPKGWRNSILQHGHYVAPN